MDTYKFNAVGPSDYGYAEVDGRAHGPGLSPELKKGIVELEAFLTELLELGMPNELYVSLHERLEANEAFVMDDSLAKYVDITVVHEPGADRWSIRQASVSLD